MQFPIECSLPWMLVDHVIELQNAGLLESVLMPFDIYNDSAQHALVVLKQRFLYDEIEAEVCDGNWTTGSCFLLAMMLVYSNYRIFMYLQFLVVELSISWAKLRAETPFGLPASMLGLRGIFSLLRVPFFCCFTFETKKKYICDWIHSGWKSFLAILKWLMF